jgi:uncharacterized LabA/DUF88 family protein
LQGGVNTSSDVAPLFCKADGLSADSFTMNDDIPAQRRLAVLIDADNAQPTITEGLLKEVAKYGVASVKRIYGDWTTPNLSGWKLLLLEHSIQPIQQFRYTVGKNSTDSAMIIDAMDLLYTRRFDGFCLVSSDSDFTRLASRIREEGLLVYGFGEEKTPKPFVAACDKFILTKLLLAHEDTELINQRQETNQLKMDTKLINLIRSAIKAASDDSGWANLGSVGHYIAQQSPEFDSRNYGYEKLSGLLLKIELFDVQERFNSSSRTKGIYVQDKRNKKSDIKI